MKRIEGPGHQNNEFTAGSATLGVPPTIVTPEWLNDKQEELCNVVEAAGIELDKTDRTQLLQAIQTLGGGPGAALPDLYVADETIPAENDEERITLNFLAGQDCLEWNAIKLWREGVAWRVALELMTSGADVTAMDLRITYLAVADGAANPVVKERWQAENAYEVGDMIIPPLASLNGYYYICSTAGTSDASAPTFGTTPGGYTNDGSALVWTCYEGGFKLLSSLPVPPGVAWQDFTFDDADLTIPEADASAGARLHLGFIRRGASDANPDDLHLIGARIYQVEV